MITVFAKLTAQPGKEAEMQAALEAMVAEVDAKEPGVLVYTMHTVDGEPGTFWMYEQYADDDALAAHNTTDHMKAFATGMRDLAAARPEIIRATSVVGVTRG
jgi:quinol monooxygenase YgiN